MFDIVTFRNLLDNYTGNEIRKEFEKALKEAENERYRDDVKNARSNLINSYRNYLIAVNPILNYVENAGILDKGVDEFRKEIDKAERNYETRKDAVKNMSQSSSNEKTLEEWIRKYIQ